MYVSVHIYFYLALYYNIIIVTISSHFTLLFSGNILKIYRVTMDWQQEQLDLAKTLWQKENFVVTVNSNNNKFQTHTICLIWAF